MKCEHRLCIYVPLYIFVSFSDSPVVSCNCWIPSHRETSEGEEVWNIHAVTPTIEDRIHSQTAVSHVHTPVIHI